MWTRVEGVVVRGHRVASGLAEGSPYPRGTIGMQVPIFASRGVDLSRYHPATINVDIRPLRFSIAPSAERLSDVRWCDEHPPETFSFSRCRVVFGDTEYESTIYYPHPETKARHFQNDHIVEILAPFIDGIGYGSVIAVLVGDEVTLF